MSRILTAVFGALLLSPAFAQSFDANIGTAQIPTGDDSILSGLVLGFNFTFPGGTVTNTIDVDTNGRVLPSSPTNVSVLDDQIATLFTQPPSLCPYWDDLTPGGLLPAQRGNIYFATTASQANVTWCNVKRFGTATFHYNDFTFQCQLHADGRIVFVYDSRVFSTNSILVGVSNGAGGFDPGEVDLGANPPVTTYPATYERYDTSDSPFDLFGRAVQFAPDGSGSYIVTNAPAGVTPCGAERVGLPCAVGYDFFPDGQGGYFVTRNSSGWFDDNGTGTELAAPAILGDDLHTLPQPLGFTFTWPGGLATTDVVVANNGRVMANGTAMTNDFAPSVAAMLTGPPPSIMAFWTDMSSQRGSLRIYNDPANQFAAITWDRTPKFFEVVTQTFQIVLRADNTFSINYKDVSLWETGSALPSDDVMMGCSAGGNIPDPGEISFTTNPLAIAGRSTLYEFWDATDEVPDIHTMLWPYQLAVNPTPPTKSFTEPRLGASYVVTMEGISSSTLQATILLGFTNPNIDLSLVPSLGLPCCFLEVNPIVPAIPLAITGSTATFSLAIPPDMALSGLPLHLQGANVAIGETPLGVVLTNGVQARIRP